MFGKTNAALQYTKAALSSLNLSGKRVAVVGGTDGLGRAIAKLASAKGASPVIVSGRTFRDQDNSGLQFMKADLSLTKEAARLGSEWGE